MQPFPSPRFGITLRPTSIANTFSYNLFLGTVTLITLRVLGATVIFEGAHLVISKLEVQNKFLLN